MSVENYLKEGPSIAAVIIRHNDLGYVRYSMILWKLPRDKYVLMFG